MDPPVVEARGLSKRVGYGRLSVSILQGADLRCERGESLAIVGCSGVGKSTLLNILGLLDYPTAGVLLYDGMEIKAGQRATHRNRAVGFVFQDSHLFEDFTPLQNVLLPAQISRWRLLSRAEAHARAEALLARVGLHERMGHPCRVLSGGERQRVAIARALLLHPPLLLADEPSGNLDRQSGRLVQDLLLEQVDSSSAFCLVTHDHTFARRCSRVLVLEDGVLRPPHPGELAHEPAVP